MQVLRDNDKFLVQDVGDRDVEKMIDTLSLSLASSFVELDTIFMFLHDVKILGDHVCRTPAQAGSECMFSWHSPHYPSCLLFLGTRIDIPHE